MNANLKPTVHFCRNAAAAVLSLIVALAAPAEGSEPDASRSGQGLRIFHIGNSWTDQAYARHDIAKGKGYTDVVWGRFMIPGAPIRHLWSDPGGGWTDVTGTQMNGTAAQIPQENKWDALVLQFFAYNGDTAQTMTESGGNFAEGAKGISERFPNRKPVRVIAVAQGFQEIGPKIGGVERLYKDDMLR